MRGLPVQRVKIAPLFASDDSMPASIAHNSTSSPAGTGSTGHSVASMDHAGVGASGGAAEQGALKYEDLWQHLRQSRRDLQRESGMLVNGHMYVLGGAMSQSATLESESDSDETERSEATPRRTPRLRGGGGDGASRETLEARVGKLAHALVRAAANALDPLFPEAEALSSPAADRDAPAADQTITGSGEVPRADPAAKTADSADSGGIGVARDAVRSGELSRASSFGSVRSVNDDDGLHQHLPSSTGGGSAADPKGKGDKVHFPAIEGGSSNAADGGSSGMPPMDARTRRRWVRALATRIAAQAVIAASRTHSGGDSYAAAVHGFSCPGLVLLTPSSLQAPEPRVSIWLAEAEDDEEEGQSGKVVRVRVTVTNGYRAMHLADFGMGEEEDQDEPWAVVRATITHTFRFEVVPKAVREALLHAPPRALRLLGARGATRRLLLGPQASTGLGITGNDLGASAVHGGGGSPSRLPMQGGDGALGAIVPALPAVSPVPFGAPQSREQSPEAAGTMGLSRSYGRSEAGAAAGAAADGPGGGSGVLHEDARESRTSSTGVQQENNEGSDDTASADPFSDGHSSGGETVFSDTGGAESDAPADDEAQAALDALVAGTGGAREGADRVAGHGESDKAEDRNHGKGKGLDAKSVLRGVYGTAVPRRALAAYRRARIAARALRKQRALAREQQREEAQRRLARSRARAATALGTPSAGSSRRRVGFLDEAEESNGLAQGTDGTGRRLHSGGPIHRSASATGPESPLEAASPPEIDRAISERGIADLRPRGRASTMAGSPSEARGHTAMGGVKKPGPNAATQAHGRHQQKKGIFNTLGTFFGFG